MSETFFRHTEIYLLQHFQILKALGLLWAFKESACHALLSKLYDDSDISTFQQYIPTNNAFPQI